MRFAMMGAAVGLLAAGPAYSADVVGSTAGIFVNAQPGTATTTGIGSNDFTYGVDATGGGPNHLIFTGAGFGESFETPFKIGSLSYYNGAINADSGATAVDLSVTLNFSSPALPAVNSIFTLSLNSTSNIDGDPDASADFVYFPASYGSSSFVIGTTTYYVELTGFGNIVGDGFLTSSSSELHVRENASATADLFAKVTAVAPPAVPEPSSWALMIIGLGVVGSALRRSRVVVRAIQFG